MKGIDMDKKINAKIIAIALMAFAAVSVGMILGGTIEALASEWAYYTPQTSDQASETVKRMISDVITDAPDNVTEAPTKEEGTDTTAQDQEGGQTSGTDQGNTSEATVTPQPTAAPTAIPTTAPTPTPTAAPHVHSYTGTVTQAASCITNGVMTYTCSCGASYTEPIPATGHAYVQTGASPATCVANGYITYTCSNCGGTKQDTLLATGHSWAPLTQQVYIVDAAAWDEPVVTYIQEVHTICNVCGFDFSAAGYTMAELGDHDEAHVLALEGSGWHTELVQVPITTYVHHDEVGHVENVVVGQVCTVCGATQ